MADYTVLITKKARKQLEKLPNDIANRLEVRILELSKDPRPPGCKKLGCFELYRVRVGNYRIVYDIEDDVLTVTVIKIGHRKNIYD